jgi:hypothetical protein
MIQGSGWEDAAQDKTKVLLDIVEITRNNLGMADGEGLVL